MITALPDPPSRLDPSTFAVKGDALLGALPLFVTEANALQTDVNSKQATASAAATTASAAAAASAGSSNYVGSWASLSGALTTPASVSYNDAVWILAADIADVTAHVPGVSAQWIRVTAEPVPASAMVLLATMTPTAAANLDVLSVFSASYDNYLIMLQGIIPDAGSNSLRMNYAVSGAVDTSSFYSTLTGLDGGVTVTSFLGYLQVSGGVFESGVGASGQFTVNNANSALSIKSGVANTSLQRTASPGINVYEYGHAYHAPNAITGFRLYWSAGANFQASGVVRVYGYANT